MTTLPNMAQATNVENRGRWLNLPVIMRSLTTLIVSFVLHPGKHSLESTFGKTFLKSSRDTIEQILTTDIEADDPAVTVLVAQAPDQHFLFPGIAQAGFDDQIAL